MKRDKIIIGITQGDINGIGYEVIIKTLMEPRITTRESFGRVTSTAAMRFTASYAAPMDGRKALAALRCRTTMRAWCGLRHPSARSLLFRSFRRPS